MRAWQVFVLVSRAWCEGAVLLVLLCLGTRHFQTFPRARSRYSMWDTKTRGLSSVWLLEFIVQLYTVFLLTYLEIHSSFQKSCKNKSDTENTWTVCPSLITSWTHFPLCSCCASPTARECVCLYTYTVHTCLVSLLCDSWLHSASPAMCQVYFVHKCFIMIGSGSSHSSPRHRCPCFHHFVDEKPGTQKGCITCPREYSCYCGTWAGSVLLPAGTSSAETFLWFQRHYPHGPHESVFRLF